MTAQVHRLTGAGPIIEPDAGIITELEALVVRAKAGEIKGFAMVVIDGADSVETWWAPGCARESTMVAGVGKLNQRMLLASLGLPDNGGSK